VQPAIIGLLIQRLLGWQGKLKLQAPDWESRYGHGQDTTHIFVGTICKNGNI